MNNNIFIDILSTYTEKYDLKDVEICDSIKNLSQNSEGNCYLCDSNVVIIDTDNIAQKIYRKVILPSSHSEDDSIKSVDGFLITNDKKWYFIEFKDSKITSNLKKDIRIKAYSTVLEFLDILYDVYKDEKLDEFSYDSPIDFFQKNAYYILVYSSEKNPQEYNQENNHIKKKEKYIPDYMRKLQGYIFKGAYAMSELTFNNIFLRYNNG